MAFDVPLLREVSQTLSDTPIVVVAAWLIQFDDLEADFWPVLCLLKTILDLFCGNVDLETCLGGSFLVRSRFNQLIVFAVPQLREVSQTLADTPIVVVAIWLIQFDDLELDFWPVLCLPQDHFGTILESSWDWKSPWRLYGGICSHWNSIFRVRPRPFWKVLESS